MAEEEHIDLMSTASSETNEAAANETNFTPTNNLLDVELCESPTTSTNAKKQNSVSSKSTMLNDEGSTQTEETKCTADETGATGSGTSLDCPICLQPCIHPARLPCGHIFCFLCIKGVAYKNQRCAMCRREIPAEFLERPQLVNGTDELFLTKCTDDGYQWYYEGRNGWWQYDIRTSQDIEDAYKKGENSCTILVAGYVYTVDLEAMVQQRQNEPTRCRRVKRDLATVPKKGVAGLRLEGNNVTLDADTASSSLRTLEAARISDSQPQTNVNANVVENNINLLTTSSMPPISSNEQQHSTETTSFVNFASLNELPSSFQSFLPNTVQSNARESEERTDSEFEETLSSLQQLTLRATDNTSSIPNVPNERQNNRYRENH